MSRTIKYNNIEYEIISMNDDEVIYTDGKNIYHYDKHTGKGKYNGGSNSSHVYRIADGFNPKPFNPEPDLLNVLLNADRNGKYLGKAFKDNYRSVYILPTDRNATTSYDELDCLIVESNELRLSYIYKSDIGNEIPLKDFVAQARTSLSNLMQNDATMINHLLK